MVGGVVEVNGPGEQEGEGQCLVSCGSYLLRGLRMSHVMPSSCSRRVVAEATTDG